MKYYYAFKILILNTLSVFNKKVIGLNNIPLCVLDWFIEQYMHNLFKLAELLNDNEALQKMELIRYWHDNNRR